MRRNKLIAAVLALVMALACAACGGQKPPEATAAPTAAPTETPAPTPVPTPEPAPVSTGPFSPDGDVIFTHDGLTVTTAGLGVDPTDYNEPPIIWVDIENTDSKDACLGVTGCAVNGFVTDAYLIEFIMENGAYYGADYDFVQTVPAGETVRFALGYRAGGDPGIDLSVLGEITLSFTLAEDEYSWPEFTSEPVTILTGEDIPAVEIAALGTVVIDDDMLCLVLGAQDYDDFFGPEVCFYAENKTDDCIRLVPDSAEADGVFCDYIYGSATMGPHQRCAASLSFNDEMRDMKGFEDFSIVFSLKREPTLQALDEAEGTVLDAVGTTYPPQVWGRYENRGYVLEVQPKFNDLITVETPRYDPDGLIFIASETASRAAGGYEGAGWLFSIGIANADQMHKILCYDMSGVDVFASDGDGNYFVYYHPTDVRYERATTEEMLRDADQWSMLCEWASEVTDSFIDENGLGYESFGNSEIDMLIARAAWDRYTNATITCLEPYGEVPTSAADGTPYAEFVLGSWFWEADEEETPDGEYMVMNFPEEDVQLDFFFAEGDYVRMTRGGEARLYQAVVSDEIISNADAIHGWYYAAAEALGRKQPDAALNAYAGLWAEEIAGRGMIFIEPSLAAGKLDVYIRWPESAAVADFWEMTAALAEDGTLSYEGGHFTSEEYDEDGEEWTIDENYEEFGSFYLDGGKLFWHDAARPGGGDSVFIRAS